MINYFPLVFSRFSAALLCASALGSAAFAQSMPELDSETIAADVERRVDPRTGETEYIAGSFDPFEGNTALAGSAALRSGSPATSIDGDYVSGGAFLDISTLYTTYSADSFDVRGFEDARFHSGQPANIIKYDRETLDCSRSSHVVSYDPSYYRGASYGYIGGIYRIFPRYRGHRNFGWNQGIWNRAYVHDLRRRNIRNGYDGLGRNARRDNRGDRSRDRDRDHAGRRDRDRSDHQTRGRNRNGDGNHGARDRNSEDRARNRDRNRDSNDRARNRDRNRDGQSQADNRDRSPAAGGTSGQDLNREIARRNARLRNGGLAGRRDGDTRRTPRQTPRRDSAATRPAPEARQPTSRPAPETRQRTRRQPAAESAPRRARSSNPPASRSERESNSQPSRPARSSRPAVNRAVDKSFSRKNTQSKKRGNRGRDFYPGQYTREEVSVSYRCVKEETLTVHIPQERLDAARFDGFAIMIIDSAGTEIPVFVPPNYVEGFRIAAGITHAQSSNYSQPQSGYTQPTPTPPAPATTREPIIYGNLN